MNKLGKKEIMVHFPKYIRDYQKLEDEYYRTPSWRIFKQLNNIHKRAKLTATFDKKLKRWGI